MRCIRLSSLPDPHQRCASARVPHFPPKMSRISVNMARVWLGPTEVRKLQQASPPNPWAPLDPCSNIHTLTHPTFFFNRPGLSLHAWVWLLAGLPLWVPAPSVSPTCFAFALEYPWRVWSKSPEGAEDPANKRFAAAPGLDLPPPLFFSPPNTFFLLLHHPCCLCLLHPARCSFLLWQCTTLTCLAWTAPSARRP